MGKMEAYVGKALILTTILTRSRTNHSGSFNKRSGLRYLRNLDDSPMFCDARVTDENTELIALTDDRDVVSGASFRRLRVVFVAPEQTSVECLQLRFLLIDRYLRARDDWTHAYSIDASDVVVLQRPPSEAQQLAIGADFAKGWLRRLMVAQGHAPSPEMRQMLRNDSAVMFNAGIVGGSRANVLAFLEDFRRRSSLHSKVNDMIPVNEYFLHAPVALTLGYPHGPVHLPFWGIVSGCANETCRHAFVRRTKGIYWFGHKIPSQWVRLLREKTNVTDAPHSKSVITCTATACDMRARRAGGAGRACNGTALPCVPLRRGIDEESGDLDSGDRKPILAKRTKACRRAAVRVRQSPPSPTKPAAFIVVTLGNRDKDDPHGARLRQFFHVWNVTCAGYPDPPDFEECRSTFHPRRGLGVTQAFVRCADSALARGHESVFFFEDDAVPYDAELCDPAARRGLSDRAPSAARVVLLGGHHFREPRKRAWYRPGAAVELHTPLHHGPDAHVFRALDFSFGAYAWWARAPALQLVTSLFEALLCDANATGRHINPDLEWHGSYNRTLAGGDWMRDPRVYAVDPLMVGHAVGRSDTWGKAHRAGIFNPPARAVDGPARRRGAARCGEVWMGRCGDRAL